MSSNQSSFDLSNFSLKIPLFWLIRIFPSHAFFVSLDTDHQLDVTELENIIQALYQLSDADMARIETYPEAIERVKQLFLTNSDDHESDALLPSVTKSEFVDIVQKDTSIMKLIDCQSPTNRRASKFENSTAILLKKQLKFKPPIYKSLSESTLAAPQEND